MESDHLYLQIAERIELQIRKGLLKIGDKLPSIRSLSKEQGVSMGTAFAAYYQLESKGLIEPRPKSGYYIKFTPREFPSKPRQSNPLLEETVITIDNLVASFIDQTQNTDLTSFALAVPNINLLPVAALNKAVVYGLRNKNNQGINYEPTPGNLDLRRQIARRSVNYGCSFDPEDIIITSGCMEALTLCLQAVTQPGDTVAIESPTYYGILQTMEGLGLKALELPTHPVTGISLEKLENALQKKTVSACLFITNFNNPLGSCMPDENKKQLVELLTKWDIPMIEDDLYGDIYFSGSRPKTCKSYDRNGIVLQCSSFSKTLAPGFRVGWTVPGRYHKKVARFKFMQTFATASLPQMAIANFLDKGRYDHHLRKLRVEFSNQVMQTIQAVKNYFPANTRITTPEGGFVLWVELDEKVDTFKLQQQALMKKIHIIPGPLFSPQGKYRNCLRLSCGTPWNADLEKGMVTLANLVKMYR